MAAAVGTVTNSANAKRSICLMVAQAVTNAAPAVATAGVAAYPITGPGSVLNADTGAFYSVTAPDESVLQIFTTAGSGTITGTFVLWGFLAAGSAGVNGPNGGNGVWVQIATLNAFSGTAPASAIQNMPYLGAYDRLYLQCTAITGTSAAFEAWLTTARAVAGRS